MSLQRQTPTQRQTSIPAPNFYPSAKIRSSPGQKPFGTYSNPGLEWVPEASFENV